MKKLLTLLFALCITALGFAQQQTVNIGTSANDRTGDPLRTAFTKVNANDLELYTNILATATASGTDTYTATPDPAITAYATGQKFLIIFTNGNTGTSTIALNGLAAKTLKKDVSTNLASGDLDAGSVHLIVYDGTNFQVLTLGGGGGGAGLVDGDYGDITVGGTGTTMTIDNGAVSGSKIASDVALAGNPTTTTQSAGNNSTRIATTAYADAKVADAINNGTTAIAPSQNAVYDADLLKEDRYPTTNTYTASHTLDATDLYANVVMNSASATDVTIPLDATYSFPVGIRIPVKRIGAGLSTVVATGGVTLTNTAGTNADPGVNFTMILEKTSANTWTLANGSPATTGAALTDVDDTNITLALSGAGVASSLLQPVTITAGWSSFLSVARGGTGLITVAQGDLLYGSAADTYSRLTKNTSATRYLSNTGTSNNPAWAQVDLTNGVTGILPVANGGNGVSNATITYSPTLTNSANLDASTTHQCTYHRVGNTVTVAGQIDIDPTTTATLTTLGVSLPVASNFTTSFQAGGVGASLTVADGPIGIFSDSTNDRVTFQYVCTDVTNHTISFTFTYEVL